MLCEEALNQHPLWKYVEDYIGTQHRYCPIFLIEEFPEELYELYTRAQFTCRNGFELQGYIIGAPVEGKNIIAIGIFFDGKRRIFNRNMGPEAVAYATELLKKVPFSSSGNIADLFPVEYETTIDLPGFRNISGEFDGFEAARKQGLIPE